MNPDQTPIAPALKNGLQAFGFIAFVLFLAILPVLITAAGCASIPDGFLSARRLGGYEYMYKEIYEKQGDIDMLFLGGCLSSCAIDRPLVEKALQDLEPRRAHEVIIFNHLYTGEDVDFLALRELLKRRRVKLVIFQSPLSTVYVNAPHDSCTTWSLARDPDMNSNLSSYLRARLYAQSVFDGLRSLITLIRPNHSSRVRLPGEVGEPVRAVYGDGRFAVRPFVCFQPPVPVVPVREMFYRTNPEAFLMPQRPCLGSYQMAFLKKSLELLAKKKVLVMMLHFPTFDEKPRDKVPEGIDWTAFGDQTPELLGIPSQRLFPGLSDEQRRFLYFDSAHLNENGCHLFSRAILQGLMHAYKQSETAK